jgi:SpoIIAA-like
MTTTPVTRAEAPGSWEPLGSDGIARIRYEVGDIVNEDRARATIVELKSLTSGKRLPVLVDIRKMKSVTREARVVFGNAADAFSALALLADSPRTQLIANFFIGLSRPKVPTQMFTDEEKALTWLRRHAV